MADIDVEFAPAPVGGRRRLLPPMIVGLTIVVLLGVAVAKPWAAGSGPTATPAVPAASALAGSTAAAASPLPRGDPSGTPLGPPVTFAGLPRPGAWGVGLGVDPPNDATGDAATWMIWTPLEPVSERREPPIRDPLPMETGCASVPTLAVAASIVGITVPEAMTTDFSILTWRSNGLWVESVDDYLSRLDLRGRGLVAELARTDRKTWPDGRYEFHILTPDHVTAVAFCIATGSTGSKGSTGPAGSASPEARLDPAIEAQIVAQLAPRSGAWGVGTGGNGPRLVREEPWTDWVPVDPVVAGSWPTLALWPGTGLCPATPHLLGHASLVAITVPSGLVPDWRLVAWWTDGEQIGPLEGIIRQVSPPGNRGISYLERVDQRPWPDGRYEFHVRAGEHEMALTVCIGVT